MPPATNSSGIRAHKRRRPLNSGGAATTKPQGHDNAGEVDPPRIMPPTLFGRVSKRKHPNSTSPIKKHASVGGTGDVRKTTNSLKLNHRHEGLNSSHGLKANSLLNATHVARPVKQRSAPRLQLSAEEIVERELENRLPDVTKVVETNLTNNYLIETFHDLPLSKVVGHIKRKYPNCEFTPGERELLEKFFERDGLNGPMGEEMFGHFPVRSKKYICKMYGRLQTRNLRKFLNSGSPTVSQALNVPRKSQPIRLRGTDPYDPEDIMTDTRVPLKGREFFLKVIYTDQDLPESPEYPEPDNGSDSSCPVGTDVPRIDDLASTTCRNCPKGYEPLSKVFSQSFGESEMKFSPDLYVRIYLFPAHCASYTICDPLRDNLNPVSQIQYFWQINWAVYFPYLARLQSIIYQLQKDLEAAWNNDDAAEILFLVDKWNLLMLFLSPNRKAVNSIVSNNQIDINQTWRKQLVRNGFKPKSVSFEDLDLNTWIDETMEELTPRTFTMTDGQVGPPQFLLPPNFYVRSRQILREQETILRYAVHTLIGCARARVVSPQNSTLSNYNPGTSEIYGELEPSLISELLETLELKLGQILYDLGLGIGQIPYHWWLESGAKSGGCEIRKNLSSITLALDKLLRQQLLTLGIQPPQINWELGKLFVDNKKVESELEKCDIVLVTNLKFELDTNTGVERLLNCLRDGSKIISLCQFHRLRNSNDLVFDNMIVRGQASYDDLVSWNWKPQEYYILTVCRKN